MKEICGVPVHEGTYWVTYGHRRENYKEKTAGKFLWFSPFRSDLEHIAVAEILGGFEAAKICRKPQNGEDFVLCLYAPDPTKLQEVQARHDADYACSSTTFRGWKPEVQTRKDWKAVRLKEAGPACSVGSLERMLDAIDPEQGTSVHPCEFGSRWGDSYADDY